MTPLDRPGSKSGLEHLAAIVSAMTPGKWEVSESGDFVELNPEPGDYASIPCEPKDAAGIVALRNAAEELVAMARAAANPALLWNESYRNHAEYCEFSEARRSLQAAVAALDAKLKEIS